MLNGLLEKKQGVIINILNDKKCAFAQIENDEQVFIEPKFTTGLKLQIAPACPNMVGPQRQPPSRGAA